MKRFYSLQLISVLFLLALLAQHGLAQTLFGEVVRLTERQKSAQGNPVTAGALLSEGQQIDARQAESDDKVAKQKVAKQNDNQGPADPNRSLPQTNSNATPLTAREKLAYGFKRTFLSPASYANTAVGAAFTQLTEKKQPQKDTGDLFADGLSRFAIRLATDSSRRMFASGIYPALFHQDPRYKPSGKKGFKTRLMYAASRVFVVENDFGNLRPNYAQLGGTLTAHALANIWERNTPGRDRIGVGPTFRRFARSTGFDVLTFIALREFGPDIKRKILKK